MSQRAARIVTAAVVGIIVLLLAASLFAQAPPLRAAVVEQQLRDVKEHRDWLESQLAAAKALNADLQEQLRAALARPCEESAK